MLRPSALLALFFACAAHPAEAQSIERCAGEFEKAKAEKLAGAEPFFAINTQGALAHDCRIVTLYALEQEIPGDFSKPTLYFAKEWYAVLDDRPRIRYADSRKCASVSAALDAVSSFHFPRIRVPAAEWRSDRVVVTADGEYYGLWTNRLANSDNEDSLSFMEVSLGDWNNDAFERLANVLDAILKPCWQAKAPGPK